MLLLRLFVDNLLPAFLAAGSGSLLAWKGRVPVQPLSKVAFWILSPCLIYKLVIEQHPDPVALGRMAAFTLTTLLVTGFLGFLAARLLRLSRSMTAAMIIVVLLPNAGNLGLAVNLFAFGKAGLSQAGLFFIVSALFSYAAGVLVFSSGTHGTRGALMNVLKVPALWGAVVAFLLLATGAKMPRALDRGILMLGDASIPLFLVILGMQLVGVDWRKGKGPVGAAVTLRLVAGALVAFAFAKVYGLEGASRQAGIFQAAMPTAVVTTILADEYGGEVEFVASAVFLSTILSPLTLTPLMALLGAR